MFRHADPFACARTLNRRTSVAVAVAIAGVAACGGGSYGGGVSAGNNAPLAPAITGAPANTTVAAGQTASFTVGATGYPPLSYQWARGTTEVQGATSPTYTLVATPADNGATFTVRVTNAYGSVTSAPATLTVQ